LLNGGTACEYTDGAKGYEVDPSGSDPNLNEISVWGTDPDGTCVSIGLVGGAPEWRKPKISDNCPPGDIRSQYSAEYDVCAPVDCVGSHQDAVCNTEGPSIDGEITLNFVPNQGTPMYGGEACPAARTHSCPSVWTSDTTLFCENTAVSGAVFDGRRKRKDQYGNDGDLANVYQYDQCAPIDPPVIESVTADKTSMTVTYDLKETNDRQYNIQGNFISVMFTGLYYPAPDGRMPSVNKHEIPYATRTSHTISNLEQGAVYAIKIQKATSTDPNDILRNNSLVSESEMDYIRTTYDEVTPGTGYEGDRCNDWSDCRSLNCTYMDNSRQTKCSGAPRPVAPSKSANGAVCTSNSDCISNNCTDGLCVLYQPLAGLNQPCSTNSDCTSNNCSDPEVIDTGGEIITQSGICLARAPVEPVAGWKTTGASCSGNNECISGKCELTVQGRWAPSEWQCVGG
jgi:hypothetical protein